MSLRARRRTRTLYIESLPAQLLFGLLPWESLLALTHLAKATDFFGVFQIFQKRQQLLPEAVIKDNGLPVALRIHQELRLLEYLANAHRDLLIPLSIMAGMLGPHGSAVKPASVWLSKPLPQPQEEPPLPVIGDTIPEV